MKKLKCHDNTNEENRTPILKNHNINALVRPSSGGFAMDGINCLISPARDIYEPGIIEKPAKYHRGGARLRNRRKTWAGLMDRPQSAPGEAFFMRFADISEDEVRVSNKCKLANQLLGEKF